MNIRLRLVSLLLPLLLCAGAGAKDNGYWKMNRVDVYGPDDPPSWMGVNATAGVFELRCETGSGTYTLKVDWETPPMEFEDGATLTSSFTSRPAISGQLEYTVLPWLEFLILDKAPSQGNHNPGTDFIASFGNKKDDIMFLLWEDLPGKNSAYKEKLKTELPPHFVTPGPIYLDYALVPGEGARIDVVYEYVWMEGASSATAASVGASGGGILPVLLGIIAVVVIAFLLLRGKKKLSGKRAAREEDYIVPETPKERAAPKVQATHSVSEAPARVSFCPNCGAKIEDPESHFCPECGTKLDRRA